MVLKFDRKTNAIYSQTVRFFHTPPPKADNPSRGLKKHEGKTVSHTLQIVNIHLTARSQATSRSEMAQQVKKYRLMPIRPGVLPVAKIDRQGYVARALNGAFAHVGSI